MRWKTEIFPIYCMLLLNHIKNLNYQLFSNMEVITKKISLDCPFKAKGSGHLRLSSVLALCSLRSKPYMCSSFFCFTWKILIFSFSDGPASIEASDPSIAPLSPKVTNFPFSPRLLPVLTDVLGLLILVKGATLTCPWLWSPDVCFGFSSFVPGLALKNPPKKTHPKKTKKPT